MTSVVVGTVQALYHYPVKSMRGQRLAEAFVGWDGLAGDRRYAFVRTGNASDFPWLTARQVPDLLRYAPYPEDPRDPVMSPLRVRTPVGADLSIEDEALRDELAARYGAPVHLMQCNRGTFDGATLSLISAASLRELASAVGRPLDAQRFRLNIVIDTASGVPYDEEGWAEALLSVGDRADGPRIRVDRKDKRCMMVNLDPETATQDPAVLRTIVRSREYCTGMYASPQRAGPIRIGDIVRMVAPSE